MFPYFLALEFLALTSVSAKISDKEYALMPDLFLVGNYDKCFKHGAEYYYCSLKIQLYPITPKNPSKIWKMIEEVSSDRRNYRHDILNRKVCVPEVCPNISSITYQNETEVRRKLEEHYDKKYQPLGLRSNVIIIGCNGQKKSSEFYDVYTLIFGIAVATYGSVLIYATFYEVIISIKSKEVKEKFAETSKGKFCSAVSLWKNWQRLTTVNTSTPDMKALRCLQGYRFYNMVYVILCHGLLMILIIPKTNPINIENRLKKPGVIAYDLSYVMQIFLMLSGFLFSYQFLVEEEKGTKMNLHHLIKSLIKRYIRLTPVLAFSICLSWILRRYIMLNGVGWYTFRSLMYNNSCTRNWWTNLLYVNNIVHVDDMCLRHTWYLAVNMQLYILSFILLCLISKYPKKVVHIFGAVIIGHISCLFIIIYRNNYYHMLLPQGFVQTEMSDVFAKPTFQFLHLSLYTNSAGVIAGLIMGYIFFKHRNKKLFTQKWHVVLWWLLSCSMPLTMMMMDTWIDVNTPLYNAAFGSTKKLIFALGNGLFLLGMTQGEGWLFRWLCETSSVYVLGRLAYCSYILHIVMQFAGMSVRGLIYFSFNTLLDMPVGDITESLVLALFATLFIEMPFTELHKCFIARKPDKEPRKVT